VRKAIAAPPPVRNAREGKQGQPERQGDEGAKHDAGQDAPSEKAADRLGEARSLPGEDGEDSPLDDERAEEQPTRHATVVGDPGQLLAGEERPRIELGELQGWHLGAPEERPGNDPYGGRQEKGAPLR
jgi:hypothetical protein